MVIRFLLVCTLVLNLVACASTPRYVTLPAPGAIPAKAEISVGDRVSITKTDGALVEFKVTKIMPEGLHGEYGLIAYDEMHSLEVKQQSTKGVWIVVGVAAAVLLGVLIYNAAKAAAYGSLLSGGT